MLRATLIVDGSGKISKNNRLITMLRFPKKIYQVPVLGNFFYLLFYAFMRIYILIMMRILGGEAVRFGNSVIWISKDKKQRVIDGVCCIKDRDPDMFSRLTRQNLCIFYSGSIKTANSGGRIYGLHERYFEIGIEGVAVFIVTSILLSEASPSFNQHRLPSSELAALRSTMQGVVNWMQQHGIRGGIVNSYRKVALDWEQSERFKNIGKGGSPGIDTKAKGA